MPLTNEVTDHSERIQLLVNDGKIKHSDLNALVFFQALKYDAVRSFLSRCEVLCEDIMDNQEEKTTSGTFMQHIVLDSSYPTPVAFFYHHTYAIDLLIIAVFRTCFIYVDFK